MMSDLWSSKDSALSSNVGGVHHENRVMTMPSFDASLPLNLTIQYGAHAHLVCRVTDLANKSVGYLLTIDRRQLETHVVQLVFLLFFMSISFGCYHETGLVDSQKGRTFINRRYGHVYR